MARSRCSASQSSAPISAAQLGWRNPCGGRASCWRCHHIDGPVSRAVHSLLVVFACVARAWRRYSQHRSRANMSSRLVCRLPHDQPYCAKPAVSRRDRPAASHPVGAAVRGEWAFRTTGVADEAPQTLISHGLSPDRASILAPLSLLLSKTIGNVPAVVMILQVRRDVPEERDDPASRRLMLLERKERLPAKGSQGPPGVGDLAPTW